MLISSDLLTGPAFTDWHAAVVFVLSKMAVVGTTGECRVPAHMPQLPNSRLSRRGSGGRGDPQSAVSVASAKQPAVMGGVLGSAVQVRGGFALFHTEVFVSLL